METKHEIKINGAQHLTEVFQPDTKPSLGYSNEIEEIISKRPPFFVRWGTFFFFIFLILIGVVCWLIQYPDIVIAKGTLGSTNAPKEVISRIDGKLEKIFVSNNETVKQGAVLGYMESLANPNSVFRTKQQIDSIYKLINTNRIDEVVRYFPDYSNQQFLNQLGELQTPFQTFIQSFISFRDFISNGFFIRKRNMLLSDLQQLQQAYSVLNQQKALLKQDVSLSQETFTANESLLKEKVISPLEYRTEKSKLIGKKLSIPQINAAIIANETEQTAKRREIGELDNSVIVQKNNFIQALQTFNSEEQAWEQKYVLKAPVAGQIAFADFLQENQQIKSGELLLYVQPGNSQYFIAMMIPQYNFGKVKKGQAVLLKLQAYPYEQYGAVIGKIAYISPTPTDTGFLAKVILPNGLKTNYNKTLQFQNGLITQADIITDNMRLLERFYSNLRGQWNR